MSKPTYEELQAQVERLTKDNEYLSARFRNDADPEYVTQLEAQRDRLKGALSQGTFVHGYYHKDEDGYDTETFFPTKENITEEEIAKLRDDGCSFEYRLTISREAATKALEDG